jgi:hypothetical protein
MEFTHHSSYVIIWPVQSTVIFREMQYLIKSLTSLTVVSRGVATARHFRHVPTHNLFPKICLLMKNDKQRIAYFVSIANCVFAYNTLLSMSVKNDKNVALALKGLTLPL